MGVTGGRYSTGDPAALLDVWDDASQIAHWFLDSEFFDQERKEIREKHLPIAESWIFEEEGRVVGFISLIGNDVGAIFVTPGRQGQGIGRALMDHARASRDHLDAEVFEANEIGRAFSDAYGFDIVETRVTVVTSEKKTVVLPVRRRCRRPCRTPTPTTRVRCELA